MGDEILEKLKKSVEEYNAEARAHYAKMAVDVSIDPAKMVKIMMEAIRIIGDRYNRRELFLPDLIGGADVVKSAMPVIIEELKE